MTDLNRDDALRYSNNPLVKVIHIDFTLYSEGVEQAKRRECDNSGRILDRRRPETRAHKLYNGVGASRDETTAEGVANAMDTGGVDDDQRLCLQLRVRASVAVVPELQYIPCFVQGMRLEESTVINLRDNNVSNVMYRHTID